jgi:hypothetical protein
MKIVNLTPHSINEVTSGLSFPPSGNVARLSVSREIVFETNNIPIYSTYFGNVEGLPDKLDGDTVYIVSALAKNAILENMNNIFPNEDNYSFPIFVSPGELVRDEKGNPIGCKGFDS